MVQRGHNFVIVDEVDSILIDEARTPLIISGRGEESSNLYEMADFFVSKCKKQVFAATDDKELQDQYDCDYIVDEKERTVSLTQKGIKKAEEFFNVENLADAENATLAHHINQAMLAALGPDAGPAIERRGEKFHVDLKELNRIWLARAGVAQIDVSAACTACRPDLYWSHRVQGPQRGSLCAVIALPGEILR